MTGDDVDLTALRVLRIISESGSLTSAARAVGVTQQAVSARVARLERRVGTPLVSRDRRGARLTDAGALVVEWSLPLLAAADEVAESLAALRRTGGGRLRVAASLTVAEYLVPRWLAALRGAGGTLSTELYAENSDAVVADVRRGRVDLGVIETPDVPGDLETRRLGVDELVVAVGPRHPWAARQRPITPRMLATTPLVVRESGSGTRRAVERALAAQTEPLTLAEPAAELPTTAAIRAMVAAPGSPPTVTSRRAVADDVALGRLVVVATRGLDLARPITAVWPRGTRPSAAAAELLRVATV